MRRLLVEQPALELVPCADCDQYPGLPRSVSSPEPRRPAAVRRGRQRRSRSRRRICVADEVCVRTDSRCTRTPLRRGIGPRPEDRPARRPRCPRRRKRAGRCRLCTGNMSQTPARTRQLLLQPIIHPTLLRCERHGGDPPFFSAAGASAAPVFGRRAEPHSCARTTSAYSSAALTALCRYCGLAAS